MDCDGVRGRSRDLRFRQRRDDPRQGVDDLNRHNVSLIELVIGDKLHLIVELAAANVRVCQLVVRLWRRRLGRILEPGVSDQWLWYTTRGAGAVSLLLLSAVVVLGILSSRRFEARGWPRFATADLHRNLALTAVVFLALHVVTAVVDPFTHLGLLAAVIPFSSYYRTFWLGLGTVSAELLVAIVVTSLARGIIGHRAWRAVHWLAYASWPVGVLHSIGTGTDVWSAWLFALTLGCVAAVGFATSYRLLAGSRDPLAAQRSSFREAVDRRARP